MRVRGTTVGVVIAILCLTVFVGITTLSMSTVTSSPTSDAVVRGAAPATVATN